MKKSVFIVLFSFLVLFSFFNRGFAYYDEGFILHAAQRVLLGEVPYKDFDLIYTPGTVFLTAASLKIFGESILAGRILSLLVSLLACYLVYKVCYKATKNSFNSFFAVLIYLAWGPTHINFPWPSMFALTAGLAALLVWPNYLVVGLITFITFIMKQNFGLAVFLSIIMSIGLNAKLRKSEVFIKFLLGILTGAAIFITYLLLTGSFEAFLNNFYYYSVKRFVLEGIATTSFPSGIKGIFYLLPALVSLIAIFLLRKKPDIIILPVFTLLFYLFGIRPTTDYPHLSPLMGLTGIPLSVIFQKFIEINRNRLSLIVVYSLGLVLVFSGFYTGLFKNYYRWDSPLYKQIYFVTETKAKIFVDRKFNLVIPKTISEIKKNTAKNEYIFIFPNAPMFYFLSERKNPTRFINLPLGLHTLEQEQEVVNDLKKRNVNLILSNESPESANYQIISEYILKNYLKKEELFEFTLWEKVVNGKHFEALKI